MALARTLGGIPRSRSEAMVCRSSSPCSTGSPRMSTSRCSRARGSTAWSTTASAMCARRSPKRQAFSGRSAIRCSARPNRDGGSPARRGPIRRTRRRSQPVDTGVRVYETWRHAARSSTGCCRRSPRRVVGISAACPRPPRRPFDPRIVAIDRLRLMAAESEADASFAGSPAR